MTRTVFKFFILMLVVFTVVPSSAAWAQNCNAAYEAIVRLREPDIGAFNIWSGVHGDDEASERYVDGAVLPNSHVFLAGEVSGRDGKNLELVLSEVDRRGRVVWQQYHPIPALESIIKVIPHKGDYIVLGNKKDAKRGASAWIGFFDAQGNFKSERIHRHGGSEANGGGIHVYDMIPSADGGFLMAVAVKANAKDARGFSSFYRLNSKGQFIAKRSYVFGTGNRISGLSYTQDGKVMASGFMMQKGNRRQGWLMKLEEDGRLIWQRQYPRGAHAEIEMVQPYGPRSILAVGHAQPTGVGGKAAWVMVVDGDSGNVSWQRYFTGNYDYLSRDVDVNDDGVISLLLDAGPPQSFGGRHFIRLISLNPRGVMLDSRAHFNGEGVDAFAMIEGPTRERIIIGAANMAYTIEGGNNAEPQIKRSREGWVIAVPAPDSYNDPCL